jgi:hypothetical protein
MLATYMKRLFAAIAAISVALFPFSPAVAAGELPVEKKLVAEFPIPWGSDVPAADDLKVFQCGKRIYLVRQTQVDAGFKGQKQSTLFVFKDDGTKVSSRWQAMAEDTSNSTVRFSGTCVGDRAVITNHWEDPVHATAGDMATSVNGEETISPLWKPDGRTIYHWYKTDGTESPEITFPSGVVFSPKRHELHVGPFWTYISGTVWKTGGTVQGSSLNFVLSPDGKAVVMHAPWFKDLRESLFEHQELIFARIGNRWSMTSREVSNGGALFGSPYLREDGTTVWSPISWGFPQFCQVRPASEYAGFLDVISDGLYFTKYFGCDGGFAVSRRIHVAESSDLANSPRVYTAHQYSIAPYTSDVAPVFAYAVRTGDGKLQIWKATVK